MRKSALIIGVITACALFLAHFVVGTIPVAEGGGWDGGAYLAHINTLGRGEPIIGDPYRAIRMSGFIPLVVASALGFSQATLISLQMFLNIGVLSVAAMLFYDSLYQLRVKHETAVISAAVLVSSWVFLVIPVFYPVLSDNVALGLSCVCLWCWTKSHKWAVCMFCVYFVWLFPGLFLIPLVFASMPLEINKNSDAQTKRNFMPAILLFLTISGFFVFFMAGTILNTPIQAIDNHAASGDGLTATPDFLLTTSVWLLASGLMAIWILVKLASDSDTWRSINPIGAFFSLLLVAGSAFVMSVTLNWHTGFSGPPLLHYMLLQGLEAPLKPFVAHFTSFGPVIILAIFGCFAWALGKNSSIPKALLVVFAGFLPLLVFGSESRQWIGIFPIAVAIFALADYSRWQRILCLIFSLLLLLPAFWLQDSTRMAVQQGLGLQSPQWQFYFGRQGPWMSLRTYELGLLGLIGFILAIGIAPKLQILIQKNGNPDVG